MLWALSIKHLCCIQSTRTLKKSDMGARGTEILPPTIYPTGSLPKGLWNPIWVKPKPESRNSTLVPNMGGKGPSSGTILCCLAGNWIRSSQNSKQHLKQLQALYSLTHFAPASRLAVWRILALATQLAMFVSINIIFTSKNNWPTLVL